MYSKIIIFLTITYLIISLSNAKTVFVHNNNNFEMTSENASMFLHTSTDDYHSSDFGKREVGRNCVPCKFGINPCCAPNMCIKKTFWPDECMEIKQAKHTYSN